jgi:hypothetical protein
MPRKTQIWLISFKWQSKNYVIAMDRKGLAHLLEENVSQRTGSIV